MQNDNITAPFVPLEWQVLAWRDKSPTLLLAGAAGGGKSKLASEKVHAYLLKYPGAVGLGLRKAREFASKSVVYAMLRAIGGGLDKSVEYKPSELTFHYANGSRLFIGGMKDEGQREALRSINGDGSVDICWMEEANAFVEEDYNEVIARMRGTAADWRQILLTTNPGGPLHWIKRRLIDHSEAAIVNSGATQNPYLPQSYIEGLSRMTGTQYKRLVQGLWVQSEGVVYDNWDEELNVTSDAEYNPDQAVFWGVDDGYVYGDGPGTATYHPRVILFVQHNALGGFNVVDELVATGETHETTILNAIAKPYRRPDAAYIDSSAAMFRGELHKHGIQTVNGTHQIVEGVKAVRQAICDGNNVRLLLVHPRCETTRFELLSYQYSPDAKAKTGELTPMKINDHALDALRYLVFKRRIYL